MFLGLLFRESAKAKRSITSWRAEAKGILPSSVDNRPIFVNATPFVGSHFSNGNEKLAPIVMVRQETVSDAAASISSTEKAGYGFGRQGEKAAGLRGFILQKPEESLPRYVSPAPASNASLSRSNSTASGSSSFYSPERESMPLPLHATTPHREGSPAFRSSPTSL